MTPGQSTWNTLMYNSTDAPSPETLYISDIIILRASVQLYTSFALQLGLQRGPKGSYTFRQSMRYVEARGKGILAQNYGSSPPSPAFSALYRVDNPALALIRPTCGSVAVDLTSRSHG